MATGFMANILPEKGAARLLSRSYQAGAMLGAMLVFSVNATEVGLAGVLGSKAILIIDGGAPRSLAVGQEYNGVKLLSVNGNGAVVQMANKKHTLRIGQNAVSNTGSAQRAEAILTADRQGHFLTNGTINGKSVRFMVDTGASKIGISRNEAERLGLDLRRGEHGMISTANGVAEAVTIKLDRVVIGGITLRNVDAIVSPQPMPFILLGMSFLNYTNMQREGNTLILKQRF